MNKEQRVEQKAMDGAPFWEDPESVGASVDLLSFAAVFARRWPFLLLMACAGLVLLGGVSFLLTPQFTSQAVFLPPAQPTSPADSPLALFLRPPSSSIYVGLLVSASVLDDVIAHTNLQASYKAKDIEQTRALLTAATAVTTDSAGFVTVKVTDKDPRQAQQIASAFMDALTRLNDRLAISEAEQHRVLFQTEFERAKNDLERSEVELKKAQEASGVVSPESQIRAGLSAIDAARADIRARRVALAAMLKGETEQSSGVQRMQSEIAAEEGQLAALENGARSGAGGALSAAQAPSVSLRFIELDREVKYNQVLFDVMAKQYESARLQENSAAPGVQIVDRPEIPLHKSKPSRKLFAATGLMLGLALGFILVFVRNRLEVLRQDPVRANSLSSFRQAALSARLKP